MKAQRREETCESVATLVSHMFFPGHFHCSPYHIWKLPPPPPSAQSLSNRRAQERPAPVDPGNILCPALISGICIGRAFQDLSCTFLTCPFYFLLYYYYCFVSNLLKNVLKCNKYTVKCTDLKCAALDQDTEHFQHPRKFPLASSNTQKVSTILIAITRDRYSPL